MSDEEKNEDRAETAAEQEADRAVEGEPEQVADAAPEADPELVPAVSQPSRRTRAERRVRAEKRAATKARARVAAVPGERKPIVRQPRPESARGKQKERRGVVVSSAMEKTIVVRVDTARPHPAYKKVVRRSKKFHVHDEQNAAGVGDVVRIVETRPLSKTKSWQLAEILEAAR